MKINLDDAKHLCVLAELEVLRKEREWQEAKQNFTIQKFRCELIKDDLIEGNESDEEIERMMIHNLTLLNK